MTRSASKQDLVHGLGARPVAPVVVRPALSVEALAPVRIMPLGDSITGSPGCWRALLWNRLQNTGFTDIDFVGTLPPQGCGVAHDGDNEGHGGFLATLADTAFGVMIKRELDLPVPPATVGLSVDYIGAVRDGDWAEAHVEIHKVGKRLTNASCLVKVGERTVLRASGVFIMA